jgi:uncharacterized protein (DUF302 family)
MSENPDVVVVPSLYSFEQTLERLERAIEAAGLSVFARFDHALAARQAGLAMPPPTVLVYGAARGGTPIMLAAPDTALDLPLRVLARQTATDTVEIVFHPIGPTLLGSGVPEALAARLNAAQALLAGAVHQPCEGSP